MYQIMRLNDILALPSVDSDGVWAPEIHGGCTPENRTVLNALHYKSLDDPAKREYYRVIAACMGLDQLNGFPIQVGRAAGIAYAHGIWLPREIDPDEPMMGQGHHRVLIAMRLQLPTMLVTDNIKEWFWED
jgi:hypothetical protein